MFSFFRKTNKELDQIISRLEANMSNNYKDAAQDNFREFEEKMNELDLSDAQKKVYSAKLEDYRSRLKEFTHKDQKPYWT
ncbi:MAG: hypothetical protein KBS85_04410 [Lachnospiraceae bacterium]|nr:hypothetical protein [Candidatus Merdinaster equi]